MFFSEIRDRICMKIMRYKWIKKKTKRIPQLSVGSLIGLIIGICFGGCSVESEGLSVVEQPSMVEQPSGMEQASGMEQPSEGDWFTEMKELPEVDPVSENLADLLQKAGASMMVQVRAEDRLGSGVIYGVSEEELIILTAGHVIADAEGFVSVSFIDGYTIDCDNIIKSERADFAVLRLKQEDLPAENRTHYLYARVDKKQMDGAKAGDGCIVFGCRTGVAAEAYEGVILDNWIYMEDYGQYMLWVKAPGKAGMSGGGLFNQKGYLLGILSGISEEDELAVVPLSLVMAELEDW